MAAPVAAGRMRRGTVPRRRIIEVQPQRERGRRRWSSQFVCLASLMLPDSFNTSHLRCGFEVSFAWWVLEFSRTMCLGAIVTCGSNLPVNWKLEKWYG